LLATLTLALGIGANVALFSVVDGVILRPLPFPEPDRVVHLAWDRSGGTPRGSVPAFKYEFWRQRSRAFEALTTWRAASVRLGEGEDGPRVAVLRVPASFMDVVGVEPTLGRGLTEADDRPGSPAVVLLGHDLWVSRWGADPAVVGRTVGVDGTPHTVVGVLPAGYAFPPAPGQDGLVLPLRLNPDPLDESEDWPILARLAPGVDRNAARADLRSVSDAFVAEHPELVNANDRGMVLSTYRDLYVGDAGDVLWALMGATALVLLIACANVAALMLARGSSRKGDLAVRMALGAGRGRVVREILAESLLLAAIASIAGLGIAHFGVESLLGMYPGTLPRAASVGLNPQVVAYAAVAAGLTGVAFGLAAAVPVVRGGVAASLRESSRGGTARRTLRKVLLAAEAAVSVVLLLGAGLLVATLAEIVSVDPGFDVRGLLAAPLPAPEGGWEAAGGLRQVEARTLEELRALPGVAAAAGASTWPLRRGLNIPVGIQGRPEDFEGAVEWRSVTPGYLETLGVPLLRGRTFVDADAAGAPPVALVNEAFAERYFPGRRAVGERIEIGRYRERYVHPAFDVGGVEIVGVVGDVHETDLTAEPRRTVLVPAAQAPEVLAGPPVLLVRARGSSVPGADVWRGVREVLAGVAGGGGAPVVREMADVVSESVATERFNALLMGVFALVALALTAFGIYGVVSYGVRQRTREIGIRVALGARRGRVTRLVMAQGIAPVVAGLGVGVVAALALARFIESLLWRVEPTDPVTLSAVVLVLGGVAAVASWLPVREATAIDPRRALGAE
jgi:predicted permease